VAGVGTSTGFDLGATYDMDPMDHLLLSAGRGLTDVDGNEASFFFAYQRTW
jgi:hypothetical protein